jgi:uncharacterized membrane protein
MNDKKINSLTKIILIISILLCILSIILPWGQIAIPPFGKVDFYCWGISGVSVLGSHEPSTELYVSFFFNEEFITLLNESENFIGFVVPMILGILILPLLIIGIILGSLYLSMESKRNIVNIRSAGIWILISIIFFYIFMQFGLLSLFQNSIISFSNYFSYASGYFIVILSGIIIIAIYIIKREIQESTIEETELMGDQKDLLKVLKERYVKGEISKEEFDQMKKDIK